MHFTWTNSLSSPKNPMGSVPLLCLIDENAEREVTKLVQEIHLLRVESGLEARPSGPRVYTLNLKAILPLQQFSILIHLGINWFLKKLFSPHPQGDTSFTKRLCGLVVKTWRKALLNEKNPGCGTKWPLGSLPALRSYQPILERSAIKLLPKPKSWLPLQSVILPPLTHTDRNTWRWFLGGMAAHWPL